MIILQQNTNNQFAATVSLNGTISNAVYLFEFQHKLSNEFWYIIPYKVPTVYNKPNYDLFTMSVNFSLPQSYTNNTSTSGNLHLIPGEYLVRVFEQTSTSNLDPVLSDGEIYQILASVGETTEICVPEAPYEGGFDDEWIIYDECQPTPIVSLSATATETPTPTPTPSITSSQTPTPTNTSSSTPTQTPTNTQTQTPTNTSSSTPTQTPTNTQTQTPTSTLTPTPTPSRYPDGCVQIRLEALSSACSSVDLCPSGSTARCYSAGQSQTYCVRYIGGQPQYDILSGSFNVVLLGPC